jgi:hypothetical protein
MIFGLQIGMLVAGLLALLTGKAVLSRRTVVRGVAARVVGGVLLLPLPLTLLVLSVVPPEDRAAVPLQLALMEAGIALGCLLVAVVLLLACGRPETATPAPATTSPRDEPAEVLDVLPADDEAVAAVQTVPRPSPLAPPRLPEHDDVRRRPSQEVRGTGLHPAWWFLGGMLAAGVLLMLCGGVVAVVVLKLRLTTPPALPAEANRLDRDREAADPVPWQAPDANGPPMEFRPDVRPPAPAEPRPKPPPLEPDPQLLAGGPKVFLSDLQERQVEGSFSKGTIRDWILNNPITVNERRSPHSLGMYQPQNGSGSKVRYALARKALVLRTVVAFNDLGPGGHLGPVTFSILGDGKLLWESQMMLYRHEPEECSVDVHAVDELELRVEVKGFGNGSPAIWLEPCLFTDAEAARKEPPTLPMRTNVGLTGRETSRVQKVNGDLALPRRRFGRATVTHLRLPAERLAECLCWSADGQSFYYLDTTGGTVGRVLLDGLREVNRLQVGRKCSWLSVSAEGLVLTVSDAQEVWLLDPATLRVLRRLRAPSTHRVVSAPPLSLAFEGMPAGDFAGAAYWRLFDLKTSERIDGPAAAYQPLLIRPELKGALVTADGKYVFTRDGSLHRFRIDGARLVLDQSSPAIVSGRDRDLCLSLDSRLVCLPSGAGNNPGLPNHPPLSNSGTYIYPVTDLHRPAFTIKHASYPGIVSFDPATGDVYANGSGNQLEVFGPTGIKRETLEFVGRGGEGRQTLVHPAGRKLLMLGDELIFVELAER